MLVRRLLPLLILAGLGAPAAADAAPRALDGSAKIREVKILRPTEGRDRGATLVWVHASHAPLTAAADSRLTSGAAHRGTVQVRIPGMGRRTATRALGNAGADAGYTVRFADDRSRARAAGLQGAPLDVTVAVRQSVDLDGDGDADGTSTDRAVEEDVEPTTVARPMVPPDGYFGRNRNASSNGFATQAGGVYIFWVSSDVGCVNDVVPHAPVDPTTGRFSFSFKGVKASGTFAADRLSVTVNASWEGVLGAGGPKCQGALPPNTLYEYVGTSPNG